MKRSNSPTIIQDMEIEDVFTKKVQYLCSRVHTVTCTMYIYMCTCILCLPDLINTCTG